MTKRPRFQINDRVKLTGATASVPVWPFIDRGMILRVSSITGKGTLRAPWMVHVTDDAGHFWDLPPNDIAVVDEPSHATKRGAGTGDRRVWAFLDGEPFSAIVKKGQASDRAVAQSMKRKLGADVMLWPLENTPSGVMYRAQWFDPKSEKFREAKVEIWMLR